MNIAHAGENGLSCLKECNTGIVERKVFLKARQKALPKEKKRIED